MDMLTDKQKLWLVSRTIEVNSVYMFPRFGFMIYSEPNYQSGEYMDTNPFTRSLDSELFLVKEKINGFCRGNFYNKPLNSDFYLTEGDLSRRGLIEIVLLYAVLYIPFCLYNLFNK